MTRYTTDEMAVSMARETVYQFLAAALQHPAQHVCDMRNETALVAFEAAVLILRLNENRGPRPLGFGELPERHWEAAELIKWIEGPPVDLFAEYDRVFGIGPTADYPPYETEFCANQEPTYLDQQMADIARFYRAFGFNVIRKRPDYIALEFEFMGLLLSKQRVALELAGEYADEKAEICRIAQRAFLNHHLGWWVPSYAAGLLRKADGGPYAALARILAAFVRMERAVYCGQAAQAPVQPRSIGRPDEQSSREDCRPIA